MLFQIKVVTYYKYLNKSEKENRHEVCERFYENREQKLTAKGRGKIMLWQIKKIIHYHMPDLKEQLSELSDPRIGIEYTIEELLMAAIMLFLLKCSSRNEFNIKQKDEQFRKNYYRMFHLNLPHMDAVDELLKKLEDDKIEEIRCHLIHNLIEKRVFHKFRFFSQYFCVAIDGTGVYNLGDNPPDELREFALKKESSKGKESYSLQVLEAVLVCSNGMNIPLISEWIANESSQYDKQDCELKAFKRLAIRLKKYFSRLKICIIADGLYSNVAIMEICSQNEWKFISVFKDGNLPTVWEEVESLIKIPSATKCKKEEFYDSIYKTIRNYRWINKIDYKNYFINWIECVQEETNIKTKQLESNDFVFITNLEANHENIVSIVKAGRARWGIEEHFNTQKNRGGNLHHKFNRKYFNAIKNWHNIRQLVCLINEFVKHTSEIYQILKDNSKMTLKELWNNLNSYLTMCSIKIYMIVFECWIEKPRQVRLE